MCSCALYIKLKTHSTFKNFNYVSSSFYSLFICIDYNLHLCLLIKYVIKWRLYILLRKYKTVIDVTGSAELNEAYHEGERVRFAVPLGWNRSSNKV